MQTKYRRVHQSVSFYPQLWNRQLWYSNIPLIIFFKHPLLIFQRNSNSLSRTEPREPPCWTVTDSTTDAMIGWSGTVIQSQISLFILLLKQSPREEDTLRTERTVFRGFGSPCKMSRIAALLRRSFGVVRQHVGTDHLGNKYYLIPEQKTWTGKITCVLKLATTILRLEDQ